MFKKLFQRLKFKAMARQLRKPDGVMGKKVGEMMNKANSFLYDFTLGEMTLQSGEQVLEIGFGNGLFFEKVMTQAHALSLFGIDYSSTMVKEAANRNAVAIQNGHLQLITGSSDALPWSDNSFDKIFCINVIYFWDEPLKHLQEIKRVLKPGGRFYATIRSKESMDLMPFTQYGFTKYSEQEWQNRLEEAGLRFVAAAKKDEPPVEFKGEFLQIYSLCLVAEKV